ncbi:undecaprenyl-diphosphate phosphatase [Bacillus cereus]
MLTFPFLLSTPAIVGAIILQFVDVFQGKAESISSTSLIVGTLSAAFFRLHSRFMDDSIFKNHSLKVFAYYVWGLGILILTLQFTHVF